MYNNCSFYVLVWNKKNSSHISLVLSLHLWSVFQHLHFPLDCFTFSHSLLMLLLFSHPVSPFLSLSYISLFPSVLWGCGYFQCFWTPCFQEISCQSIIMLVSFPAYKTDGERKQEGVKHREVWLWHSKRCLYSEATERKKIKEQN